MAGIYRKASMDRLSSPEQLDKMIRIASPSLWIAVAGAGLVVVSVLVWSIFGRLPNNVSVSGLYMSNTSVQGAYVTYGGKVSEMNVEKDQVVQAGDVIAVIENDTSDTTIDQLEKRIQAVEQVTLVSKDDEATSDNSKLLEYKLQYQQAGMTTAQKEETLKSLKKQLEQAKQEAKTYKASMDAAENAYLAALGDDGVNAATFQYQAAQADLQAAQSRYQTAYSQAASLESSYSSAAGSLQSLKDQYETLKSQLSTLLDSYNSQKSQLSAYQSQLNSLQQSAGSDVAEGTQQQIDSLEQSIAALSTSTESLGAQIESIQGSVSELESGIATQEAQVSTLSSQLSSAQGELSSAEAQMNSAQATYDSAESIYGSYYSTQNQTTANQTRLSTAFQEASTLYSNAYSKQQSLEQQIENSSLETGFENQNKNVSKTTLKKQFDSTKESLLKDLKNELDTTKTAGAREEIVAQISGTVVDCPVQKDQVVGQGTEVVKIKSDVINDEIVRCYVPIGEGKKLESGMKVVVTPSTVSESEYGHMTAVVSSVGTYAVSVSDMQKTLGNDLLVQAYEQQGPCVEVLVTLDQDPSTASGYAWSNKKGETVVLAENTPITAKVRVKEDAPITKLIPFLKSKMEVKVDTSAAES